MPPRFRLVFAVLAGAALAAPDATGTVRVRFGPQGDGPLPPCGGATTANTDLIVVHGAPGASLGLDLRAAPLAPGRTPGIFLAVLRGGDGDDVLAGRDLYGADRTPFAGELLVEARGGRDLLVGGAAADRLLPGPGRDVVRGGPGDDSVLAADGERDLIRGGPGRDRVDADCGLDRLAGIETAC